MFGHYVIKQRFQSKFQFMSFHRILKYYGIMLEDEYTTGLKLICRNMFAQKLISSSFIANLFIFPSRILECNWIAKEETVLFCLLMAVGGLGFLLRNRFFFTDSVKQTSYHAVIVIGFNGQVIDDTSIKKSYR